MALKEIEKLREKVDKDPNSKLFVPLAEEYKKEGMLDEAIQVLLTGIERQPGYMSARVSLGKIYLEKGMRKEARVEFENVIKSIPDNLYAHKKLAEIYRDTGEKQLAIRSYRTILKLNSMDEDALASLHELEDGGPAEMTPEAATGEEGSPEEDLLQGTAHEVAPEEVTAEEAEPGEADAVSPEPTGAEELSAFKESLFGGGADEADMPEEIIAEDITEGDAAEELSFSGIEEEVADVAAVVPEEEEVSGLENIPSAEEEAVTEEITEVEDSDFAGVFAAEGLEEEVKEDVGEAYSGKLEEADRKVAEGDYGGAVRLYREVLSGNPDDRRALQRLEELRSLLKMLGKDKEELIARLSGFLEGIQKRHNEFLGRP